MSPALHCQPLLYSLVLLADLQNRNRYEPLADGSTTGAALVGDERVGTTTLGADVLPPAGIVIALALIPVIAGLDRLFLSFHSFSFDFSTGGNITRAALVEMGITTFGNAVMSGVAEEDVAPLSNDFPSSAVKIDDIVMFGWLSRLEDTGDEQLVFLELLLSSFKNCTGCFCICSPTINPRRLVNDLFGSRLCTKRGKNSCGCGVA